MARIKLIVGLGNKGRDYENTRHNLGFAVVDSLKGQTKFLPGKGQFYFCQIMIGHHEIALLKPTTFMNHSGSAVSDFSLSRGLTPQEILAIADDFNLPLGRIRLREYGSDGGHNGLASLIFHLQSDQFPRIRLGVGPIPQGKPAEDFVLEKFESSQNQPLTEMVERSVEAIKSWVINGYEKAAAQYNVAIVNNNTEA